MFGVIGWATSRCTMPTGLDKQISRKIPQDVDGFESFAVGIGEEELTKKILACPFCACPADKLSLNQYLDNGWLYELTCTHCEVTFFAAGERDLLDSWNRRQTSHVDCEVCPETRGKTVIDKRIVVPEEMLKAAARAYGDAEPGRTIGPSVVGMIAPLEAALRWQSENPQTPDEKWLVAYANTFKGGFPIIEAQWTLRYKAFIYEWIARGMYVAPELEVPEVPEEIKDLLEPVNDYHPTPSADFRIIEAYRRGLAEKEKC